MFLLILIVVFHLILGRKRTNKKYGQYKIRISPSRIGSSSKLSKWEMKDNESLSGRELSFAYAGVRKTESFILIDIL